MATAIRFNVALITDNLHVSFFFFQLDQIESEANEAIRNHLEVQVKVYQLGDPELEKVRLQVLWLLDSSHSWGQFHEAKIQRKTSPGRFL